MTRLESMRKSASWWDICDSPHMCEPIFDAIKRSRGWSSVMCGVERSVDRVVKPLRLGVITAISHDYFAWVEEMLNDPS